MRVREFVRLRPDQVSEAERDGYVVDRGTAYGDGLLSLLGTRVVDDERDDRAKRGRSRGRGLVSDPKSNVREVSDDELVDLLAQGWEPYASGPVAGRWIVVRTKEGNVMEPRPLEVGKRWLFDQAMAFVTEQYPQASAETLVMQAQLLCRQAALVPIPTDEQTTRR